MDQSRLERESMTPGAVSNRVIGRRLELIQIYDEVSEEELYRICAQELGDIERISDVYRRWVKQHPDKMEQA